jgi:hypothetical protein
MRWGARFSPRLRQTNRAARDTASKRRGIGVETSKTHRKAAKNAQKQFDCAQRVQNSASAARRWIGMHIAE